MLELLRKKTGLDFEEAKDSHGNPVYWVGRLQVSRCPQGYFLSGKPFRLNVYYNKDYRQPIDPTRGNPELSERRWKVLLKAIVEVIPEDKLPK